MSSRGRICFYAPYLYPLFSAERHEMIGGAEVQQAMMARGLAARGFVVVVATCDYGQPAEEVVDGVRLLRTFRPFAGLPVVRFFHPRLTRTLAALNRADADIYYARAGGQSAGIASEVARARGAAFVFGAAHDHDARASMPLVIGARDRWWYPRALRHASRIIAQTEHQRLLFEQEFGLASEVVPNLVELPARTAEPGSAGLVLWIGTWKAAKRPDWMLALARRMPDHRFVMCGVVPPPPETRDAWEAAQAAAERLPNLEVHGFLDRDEIGALYRRASLFVHTSPAEGFPNTLLEAWAHGLPSVSIVDPDGVVARERIGEVVGSAEELERAVVRLMADPEARRQTGARARRYVSTGHDPNAALERLAGIMDSVLATVRRRVDRRP
jgi:glycosyltransferase involved in cell wall biosynthesis